MFKIQILMPCIDCKGQAYIFDCRAIANNGEEYDRHKPCPVCGNKASWIDFPCFLKLLEETHSIGKGNGEINLKKFLIQVHHNQNGGSK